MTENKVSLVLALTLLALALLVVAHHSMAGSPAVSPPVLFCGLLIECLIG
jgi:hypothetical protein